MRVELFYRAHADPPGDKLESANATATGTGFAKVQAAGTERKDKEEARTDLDKLQGTWRVVSSQVGDEKALEDEFKKRKVTVKGSTLIYEYGNEQKEKREGTIKVDAKTKAFDWTWISPEPGPTMLAIYQLKGEELRIGFGNDNPVQLHPLDS